MLQHAIIAALVFTGADTILGPEWEEGCSNMNIPDAGVIPATAQKTMGTGPLQAICGELTGNGLAGGGDFQDMYLIRIVDPASFSASTFRDGGIASFDTELFLFNEFGMAQLANDDATSATSDSEFFDSATDGTGFVVTTPGRYYLAISGYDSNPLAFGGTTLMFDQLTRTEVSGPDGGGATGMVDGWTPGTLSGTYRIGLEGASFAFCPGDVNGDDVVDVTDLLALMAAWGTDPIGPPDFNLDGTVDTADLLFLLANWGPCFP